MLFFDKSWADINLNRRPASYPNLSTANGVQSMLVGCSSTI
jgi:hypothetical protein